MLSTISIGDRILAVRCLELDKDYQLADLARSWLLSQKLIEPMRLQKSTGEALEPLIINEELPIEAVDWQCPCSCHCGNYECDECYEAIDTSTEEMDETLTESSAVEPALPEPALPGPALRLYPAETPLEAMSGVCLRLVSNGLEMLKVEHRETSYYLFWTEQKVHSQVLGQLVVKPVEPL